MLKYGLLLTITFLLQVFLAELLSIKGVRPDFLIIFVLYFSIKYGSSRAVIVGFVAGLLIGFVDNSSAIGVHCAVYSIVGYLGGFLQKQKSRMLAYQIVIFGILIIVFGFLIYSYLTFFYVFYDDLYLFIRIFVKTTIYTTLLAIIMQILLPMQKI